MRRHLFQAAAFGLLIFSTLARPMAGQTADQPAAPPDPPCQGGVWWADSDADYADFDFWVGEWQVFDRESGLLMGLDVIEKLFGGCALHQQWRQLNDRYAVPGMPRRLRGTSHTSLGADGRWHQVWVDNNGSWLPTSGGLDASGTMVLETEWQEFRNRQGQLVRLRHRWQWRPQPDGTIHNWGDIGTPDGDGVKWQRYFDIVYRRNERGGPQAHLDPGDENPS